MTDGVTTKQFDHDDPKRNMYGVLPCPKCGSRFRWPTQPVHPEVPNVILCDDCGHREPITPENYHAD